jgi:hypothetical protein
MVMLQIKTCLKQAFEKKEPPSSQKWKAFIRNDILYLFHYHHKVLVYDVSKKVIIYEWWEKKADKRGLDDAKIWLSKH